MVARAHAYRQRPKARNIEEKRVGILGTAILQPKDIQLIVFDFDGVMTDNRVLVSESGQEFVVVSRADGWGVTLLREQGFPMLILSTELNSVVAARAAKLKLPVLHGVDDKEVTLRRYCRQHGYDLDNVLYVGNDSNDIAAMRIVGLSVVPADAHQSAKAVADIVLNTNGGYGVVRELAEMILNGENAKL